MNILGVARGGWRFADPPYSFFGVGFGDIEGKGRADKRSAIRHEVHKPLPFFMEPASYREFNLHNTGTKHKP